MTLEDKIIQKEDEFFQKHLQSPDTIILRPDTKMQLTQEIYAGTKDRTECLLIDIDIYMGMAVAVTSKDGFPEFKLAVTL